MKRTHPACTSPDSDSTMAADLFLREEPDDEEEEEEDEDGGEDDEEDDQDGYSE